MKKGQSLGILFPLLVTWIFVVVMIGLSMQSQCSYESTIEKIQNTPNPTISSGIPFISDIINFGGIIAQSVGYFIGLIGLMFKPCAGASVNGLWILTIGLVLPVGLIMLLKIAGILRGSE